MTGKINPKINRLNIFENLPLFLSMLIFWGSVESLLADEAILGYRGKVYELSATTVRSFDLRADGRYLYFSSGTSQIQALDLQTMATFGPLTSVDGSVLGVFVNSSGGLNVATTDGVQYFSLTKPLIPDELSTQYVRPSSAAAWTVIDACAGGGKTVLLERHGTEKKHQVRVVTSNTAVTSTSWQQLIGSNYNNLSPFAVRCSETYALVAATESGFSTSEAINDETLWLSSFAIGNPTTTTTLTLHMSNDRSLSSSEGGSSALYQPIDFVVSTASDQLLLLFNRKSESLLNTKDDAVLVGLPLSTLSLSSAITHSIGSQAKGLAMYKVSGGSQLGVFVAKDELANNPSDEDDKLLRVSLPLTSTLNVLEDRGAGSSTIGSIRPSLWKSTASDFKFGRTESVGLTILASGPLLEVATPPVTTSISSSTPLEFGIRADRDSVYEVYFDPEASANGTSSGLSRTPQKLVEDGRLTAGTTATISLTPTELDVAKNGDFGVLVQVRDEDLNATTAPLMRQGLEFSYDPPPDAVGNFRLEFGNQSIFACFTPPAGGDIASYEVYFSYTSSDLDNPVASTFQTQVGDTTLTSPATVTASAFGGCYGIYPVKNNQLLYVRVRAKDTSDQTGAWSDIASRKAYRTLRVDEALGGVESCALSTTLSVSPKMLLLILVAGLSLVWIRLQRKKIGPSTSRNRRGGD